MMRRSTQQLKNELNFLRLQVEALKKQIEAQNAEETPPREREERGADD